MSLLHALAHLAQNAEKALNPFDGITELVKQNTYMPPQAQQQTVQAVQPQVAFSMPQVHNALYTAYSPQANQLGGDFGTPIQGQQNIGYIPMQGSEFRQPMPVQNGYDQRIQY